MKTRGWFWGGAVWVFVWSMGILGGSPVVHGEEVNFRLGWKFGPEYASYYSAVDRGFFSKAGLDVKILEGSGSTDNVKLVGARKIPIADIDAGALITGLSQDIPLVSVMATYQKSPMGLVSRADTPMSKPSDLQGKSIGRNPKSVTAIGLDVFLKRHNLTEARLIPVGYSQEPLLLKKVDALTTYVNTDVAVLRFKGHEVNLLLFSDWGLEAYGATIATHRKLLEDQPDLVRRFTKAVRSGWTYILKNEERAADIFRKYHPRVDRKFALNVLKLTKPLLVSKDTEAHGLGWQTEAMWKSTQDFYHAGGVLKKRIDVKTAFTNDMLK